MSTDVMAVLENARTRLSGTQQRADEVEAHARRVLDMLSNETTAWREAIAQEREFTGEITARLGKRWSTLEARIGELTTRATEEWTTVGEGFASHWEAMQQRWNDCATNLQEVKLTLGEHQQHCETSREDHRGFASSHATVLDTTAEKARSRVIVGGQAIGEAFADRAAENQAGIDASLAQHGRQVDSTASGIRLRQEEATSQIELRRTDFDSEMYEKYDTFESATNERINNLKQTAGDTKTSMESAAEAIGDTTSTLVRGADDVVEVLNLTNVGLSTVVGIVQNAIEICEEIIDCWES
jgi:hypothetical protein